MTHIYFKNSRKNVEVNEKHDSYCIPFLSYVLKLRDMYLKVVQVTGWIEQHYWKGSITKLIMY